MWPPFQQVLSHQLSRRSARLLRVWHSHRPASGIITDARGGDGGVRQELAKGITRDTDMPDPHAIYFPEAESIPSLALAFMRMMFAHANFDVEVRRLQATITMKPDGEQPDTVNLGNARERPERMRKLIEKHLGSIPEKEPIVRILNDAIDACDERNLLAHGEWWRFDSKTSTIKVRGERKGQLEWADYTEDGIVRIDVKLRALKTELYKLRRDIEHRRGDHDVDESVFKD
jgi:hypothetical protein